jgi:hypothetical protein
MCAHVKLRSSRVRSTFKSFLSLDQNSRFNGKQLSQVHPVRYILSGWKLVQMNQPEFVDSPVYFDALVLKYLS